MGMNEDEMDYDYEEDFDDEPMDENELAMQ